MGSDIDNNPLQDSQLIDTERTVNSQSTAQQIIDYSSQPDAPSEEIVDSSSIQEHPSELAIDSSKPEVSVEERDAMSAVSTVDDTHKASPGDELSHVEINLETPLRSPSETGSPARDKSPDGSETGSPARDKSPHRSETGRRAGNQQFP